MGSNEAKFSLLLHVQVFIFQICKRLTAFCRRRRRGHLLVFEKNDVVSTHFSLRVSDMLDTRAWNSCRYSPNSPGCRWQQHEVIRRIPVFRGTLPWWFWKRKAGRRLLVIETDGYLINSAIIPGWLPCIISSVCNDPICASHSLTSHPP